MPQALPQATSPRFGPILGKARLHDLRVHVGRSGLCLNDPAQLRVAADGRIEVMARMRRRLLGVLPRWRWQVLGELGPRATVLLGPWLEEAESLRLRIVGLTPEHIAAPEVFVSVWGEQRLRFSPPRALQTAPQPQDLPRDFPQVSGA